MSEKLPRLTAAQVRVLEPLAADESARIESHSGPVSHTYIRAASLRELTRVNFNTAFALIRQGCLMRQERREKDPWYATYYRITDLGRAALARAKGETDE